MIGWAAATGDVSLHSALLFMIIFLWTPPHFWALALYRNADYRRAGIPMLPVIAGITATTRQMLLYTVLLVSVTLAPYALGMQGAVYGVLAVLLGAGFLFHALRVWRTPQDGYAKRMFAYSIIYLFALLAAMLLDRLVMVML